MVGRFGMKVIIIVFVGGRIGMWSPDASSTSSALVIFFLLISVKKSLSRSEKGGTAKVVAGKD